MDAYTQSSHIKQFSLSGLQLHPMEAECLCEYVAMPRVEDR